MQPFTGVCGDRIIIQGTREPFDEVDRNPKCIKMWNNVVWVPVVRIPRRVVRMYIACHDPSLIFLFIYFLLITHS